jgi:hypothetical protein
MKTLQSIPLGNAAADSFLLLDDESVGRIVRALVYAARNELPAVPKRLRPVYFAVLAESCRIRGAKVPRPQDIRFADTPEAAQDGKPGNAANAVLDGNAILDGNAANADNAVLDGKGVEEKRREEKREDIFRTESEDTRARAGKPASDSDSDSDDIDFFSLRDDQLVPAALWLVRESGNARMRGRLVKARRTIGPDALRDLLATFAAEIRAGEVPANPGATLNARLTAREALA